MFADPLVLPFNVGTSDAHRLGTGEDSASYATSDRAFKLRVFHTYGKRVRHVIRVQKDSLVANPLISGQNVANSMSVYLTVDLPPGYDTEDAKDVTDMLVNLLDASSGANVTKLLGGES